MNGTDLSCLAIRGTQAGQGYGNRGFQTSALQCCTTRSPDPFNSCPPPKRHEAQLGPELCWDEGGGAGAGSQVGTETSTHTTEQEATGTLQWEDWSIGNGQLRQHRGKSVYQV